MNGGSLGAMHLAIPWGDPLLASMGGSNAILWGADETYSAFASMDEEPESFGDATIPVRCEDRCEGLRLDRRIACHLRCGATSLAVVAVGVGVILIGALALTK